ncbi:hypothetical protein CERSUDRAFT_78459 [Gelatoporia subvermispora B]|uniref:Uncharacterized protein n=1 Tax=Ceriporiopsis subvermispora (strain B) TaxID=914234 RepID=M2QWY8_CERS8|nr:hypothetical protein CERSUDRAFT_78459 [Gelatoporia subvermispora B]
MQTTTTPRMQYLHYDILREIFEQTRDLEGGRRTLAALAHVCKDFQDAALDVLWHKLDSLEPLLRHFTVIKKQETAEDVTGEEACDCDADDEYHLCETCNVVYGHDTLILEAPISSAEWSKFKTYARRVCHLLLCEKEQWIHPSIFVVVFEKARGEAVLPSLRNFEWVVDSGSNPGPVLFLPPELRSIEIYCDKDSHQKFFRWTCHSILRTIHSLCPKLRDITIDPQLNTSPEELSSFQNLRRLTFARSRKIDTYRSDLLGATASLGALETFDTWLPGGVGHETFPTGSDVVSYNALKTLSLFTESSWCAIASVLSVISSPRLLSLSIRLQHTCSGITSIADELLMGCHDCGLPMSMNLLAERWSNCLQILTLDLEMAHTAEAHIKTLPDFFALLYPLRQLTRLEVGLGDIVECINSVLGDSDVDMMAASWPKLQYLCIDKAHRWIAIMSIKSLVSYVYQSRHLKQLEFPVLLLGTPSDPSQTAAEVHTDPPYQFRYLHIHHLLPIPTSEVSFSCAAVQLCSAFPMLCIGTDTNKCGKKGAFRNCEWEKLSQAMQLHRNHNTVAM